MAGQLASTTIVVGMDFSEEGERALEAALRFASNFQGVDVHVLHVDMEERNFDASHDVVFERLEDTVQGRCEALAVSLGSVLRVRVLTHIRRGVPATQIVQIAADLNADLVVVGTRGKRGLERLMLGSVAEAVARHACCPVWIVRAKDHDRAGDVPNIEPPCARCVGRRQETQGEQLWCATHIEKYVVPHRLTYSSEER